MTAVVPRSASVKARIYFVDGKVAVVEASSAATAPRPEPNFQIEAGT
jgi:hypothetical protein